MPWLARPSVVVARTEIPASGDLLARLVCLLPDDEKRRAARFRHDDDRARFTIGRLLLRRIIADGGEGRLDYEESGRPIVVEAPLFVSLAHSGRHVLAARARRPVGVDVESLRAEPAHPGLEARVCSPAEAAALDILHGDERERAFMAIWTRKEAYGKALGVGVGFGLQTVTAGPDGSRIRGAAGRWWVGDLDLGDADSAALVVRGRQPKVTLTAVDAASLAE
jgi:4'-phosphopantetheinyl transferase